MKRDQSLSKEILSIDLAFSSCIPLTIKNHIDEETRSLLSDLDSWRLALTKWINFVRENHQLTCLEPVRTNNHLSLGLIFTDDLVITELNNKWRKKNIPTDVLSFAALDGEFIQPSSFVLELGDIFVSVETAFRQASFYNHSLEQELNWLVSHGILHLLGGDHPCSESLSNMLTLQEELITIKDDIHSEKYIKVD